MSLKAPDPLAALGLALEDEITLPEGSGAFLNADDHPALGPLLRDRVLCEQPFRPGFDRLTHAGWRVEPRIEGGFAFVLVLLGKHAEENRLNLARAWRMLSPGGFFLLAGSNEVGAARWERIVLPWLDAPQTAFRRKSRLCWGVRKTEEPAELAAWLALEGPLPILEGAFVSYPGLFGWDKLDRGSALLARHLPDGIAGDVADLGAGWGFLSDTLLRRFPAIRRLDVVEADARGIEAARRNLARIGSTAQLSFHWQDATSGLPGTYDWILCNPPFHEGRAAQPELGQAILVAALAALKPGGTLLVVANRHLPYEAVLGQAERVADEEGFKVLAVAAPARSQGRPGPGRR